MMRFAFSKLTLARVLENELGVGRRGRHGQGSSREAGRNQVMGEGCPQTSELVEG